MPEFMRLMRADDTSKAGEPMAFMASTPGTKRDGADLSGLPWTVDNYRANPVVTWVHDFAGQRLPIGRGEVEVIDGDGGETMRALIAFDQGDEFAREVERKYRDGFLHAVSVSWDDVTKDGVPVRAAGRGAEPVAHDLLEIAAVPVPGDASALAERQVAAMRSLVHDYDAALSGDDGGDGAGSGGVDLGDGVTLSRMSADDLAAHEADQDEDEGIDADDGGDVDEGDASDPETGDDGEALGSVARAVAAMATALDAGLSVDDRERRRLYNAACVLYRHTGLVAPEFVGGAELRVLATDDWCDLFVSGELPVGGERAGAVLNRANRQRLRRIRDDAGAVLASAGDEDGDGDSRGNSTHDAPPAASGALMDVLADLKARTGMEA